MRMGVILAAVLAGAVAVVALAWRWGGPLLQRHRCRVNQGEARQNLLTLASAEEAFRARFGYYTSDLVSLEWSPEGAPRYVYGFAYPGPSDLTPAEKRPDDYDDSRHDTLAEEVIGERFQTNHMVDRNGDRLLPKDLPEQAMVERGRYKAAAVGDPEGLFPGLDVWLVDEKKELINVADDCR